MAYLTAEQQEVRRQLREEFGIEEFARLERTDEAYGVLWIHVEARNFFVRPDGDRLTWQTLVA